MIIVDTREKKMDEIKTALILTQGCPEVQFLALDKGDYHLSNDGLELRVERKSIADFCSNYMGLKKRLQQMRSKYDMTALLLEGSYDVIDETIYLYRGRYQEPVMPLETMTRFVTHQQKLGTWLIRTQSLTESMQQLVYIHNYFPKLQRPVPAIKAGNPTEWFLMLPRVGQSHISKLMEEYDTPYDALMDLEKWATPSMKAALGKWL